MFRELQSLEQNKYHSVPVVTHDPNHQKEATRVVVGGAYEPSSDLSTSQRILLKMKKDGDYVQNLPYLYRCPSI
jgi:predicted  nucleic acid-binding Zn-ribbon protein